MATLRSNAERLAQLIASIQPKATVRFRELDLQLGATNYTIVKPSRTVQSSISVN